MPESSNTHTVAASTVNGTPVPANSQPVVTDDDRRSVRGFLGEFTHELHNRQGVSVANASTHDNYQALASAVRHYLMDDWLDTVDKDRASGAKTVGYLSAEYLLGPQLDNNLLAANLTEIAGEAMASSGTDLDSLRAQEVEPGLGNGGLGRLAACFIDSLATMGVPCIGYGIRYEYGIFRQSFVDGRQVEEADSWLAMESPWEFVHPEHAVQVNFAGHTERHVDENGRERTRWVPGWNVQGLPYNYLVPGYCNGRVNTLRLWGARATKQFDLQTFNSGDYVEAVRAQTFAENISKVLYPEDSTPQGKELRLQQQYFFVACSLRDFIDHHLEEGFDLRNLAERIIFQLNDTHPVIAVPELMRILVDEQGFEWDEAWEVTKSCFAYTCHTLLPEALEVWSTELLGRLLPRHMEIINQINETFMAEVREAFPGDEDRARRMSIVTNHPTPAVRMAHLATVAGSKVNGVAALHSQLLRDKVLPDFSELWPDKFTNVTNGVTPRRFVRQSNPRLSELVTSRIGSEWVTDLDEFSRLEGLADNADFREQFRAVKAANKDRLRDVLRKRDGIDLPEGHLLDVMVKRLHEYKRQTLKLLHIVSLYEQVLSGKRALEDLTPRTVVFGAKAAPGYKIAKEIIHLINSVAQVVNEDTRLEGRLKVAFPANYNVTLAEKLIPATDLSEQISLAGKEASGTGNMKFALNGALTVGTDDGANVEIRQLVGDDNFFLFGMDEPQAAALTEKGYDPHAIYAGNDLLKATIDLIDSGVFAGGNRDAFRSVTGNLLHEDRFMVFADFASYLEVQDAVEAKYADTEAWTRSAILNVARTGFFSSDRSMRDYLERIWHAKPVN